MSVLPQYARGRISIPWWYSLGWISSWVVAGIFGIRRDDTMEIIISDMSIIAMGIASIIGAVVFSFSIMLSRYAKQRTDAAKLERKIVESGRDPENIETLTANEKWELSKAKKVDKIFLIGYAFTAIAGALLAMAVLVIAQDRIPDEWLTYAVYGLILGLIASWLIYETVTKSIMAGEWQKKSEEAFRVVKAVADKAVEVEGGYDALIAKLMASGVKKSEAKQIARDMIAKDPTILDAKKEEE